MAAPRGRPEPDRRAMATDRGDTADSNDPLLQRFLAAADERLAEEELGRLLGADAVPVLDRVLRGQLRGDSFPDADLEDLRSSALLRLARQLQSLRQGQAEPIASFAGYVAVTGFNAWRAWLRQRHPERARLQDRLRYVLTHDRDLGLWASRGGEWHCGRRSLRPQGPFSWPAVDSADLADALAAAPDGWEGLGFAAQVRSVLTILPRPCRLADLTALLAERLGLLDREVGAAAGEGVVESLADPRKGPVEQLMGREYLARLWAEIVELPRAQRVALLLNLRDDQGREMLGLLPLTGVADPPAIAAALELSPGELAAIWPDLPRDDLWIAERLGLTRRQVINLRKSARARLARRMGGAG